MEMTEIFIVNYRYLKSSAIRKVFIRANVVKVKTLVQIKTF